MMRLYVLLAILAIATPAVAEEKLSPGMYVANFTRWGGCAILVIKENGKMTYQTGEDCTHNPPTGGEAYVAQSVTYTNGIIHVDAATFVVTEVTGNISGDWELFGNQYPGLVFKKAN